MKLSRRNFQLTSLHVSQMRNCGMRNAEGKMRNGMCGKLLRNGG